MIKKITWLSWTGLGLMVPCVLFTILILTKTIAPPVSEKLIDYENVFILPLAALSCVSFTMFLVKARKMHPIDKRPWISFSVASYLYFVAITLLLVRHTLDNIDVKMFTRILPDFTGSICLVAAVIAIFFGFYAESRTTAKNLPLSNYIGVYFLLYISTGVIEHFIPIGAMLRIALGYLLPALFCIYVINSIGNQPKALCYKVLLAGFVLTAVIVVVFWLLGTEIDEPIWAIVNLFFVVVASDMRTQIWLREQN